MVRTEPTAEVSEQGTHERFSTWARKVSGLPTWFVDCGDVWVELYPLDERFHWARGKTVYGGSVLDGNRNRVILARTTPPMYSVMLDVDAATVTGCSCVLDDRVIILWLDKGSAGHRNVIIELPRDVLEERRS